MKKTNLIKEKLCLSGRQLKGIGKDEKKSFFLIKDIANVCRRTGVCDAMMMRQLFQTQSLSGMLEKVGVALIDLDFFVLPP